MLRSALLVLGVATGCGADSRTDGVDLDAVGMPAAAWDERHDALHGRVVELTEGLRPDLCLPWTWAPEHAEQLRRELAMVDPRIDALAEVLTDPAFADALATRPAQPLVTRAGQRFVSMGGLHSWTNLLAARAVVRARSDRGSARAAEDLGLALDLAHLSDDRCTSVGFAMRTMGERIALDALPHVLSAPGAEPDLVAAALLPRLERRQRLDFAAVLVREPAAWQERLPEESARAREAAKAALAIDELCDFEPASQTPGSVSIRAYAHSWHIAATHAEIAARILHLAAEPALVDRPIGDLVAAADFEGLTCRHAVVLVERSAHGVSLTTRGPTQLDWTFQ